MPLLEGISRKLVAVTASCAIAIFAVTLGYNEYASRKTLERQLEVNARNLALSLANRVEAEIAAVTKITATTATALEVARHSEPQLLDLLQATVSKNPEIVGAAVAFEPYAFRPEREFFAPYVYRDAGGIRTIRLEDAYGEFEYPYWDWYQIPRELGQMEWSEPYYDTGAGKRLMSTCSVPFYLGTGEQRRLSGIVTSDLSLEALTQLVSSVRILETGYAALLSRNGVLLAHPLRDAVMNESFFTIAEERNDPAQRELGQSMVRGESGFVLYNSLVGVRSWMYYTPIRSTGWTLAVVFPEKELLASVHRLSLTMAAIGAAGVALLVLVVALIANRITRPLRTLANATHAMAAGNFDAPLPEITSRDEVGALARDFASMQGALKQYVADLTETTAAKERIQGELRLATDIQASLLPRVFPAFPDHSELEIFAAMDPAKEVGGDFYDFFFVDDDRVCFLVADVADKGVPAALYMMVAKTLLKTEAQRLVEPDQILASVNDILAEDNDRCMFASVFCAVLDVRTGAVTFASAGHNPPLLLGPDGADYVTVKPGLMLGPMPGARYEAQRLMLSPGEALFLYTDGVTEAKSRAEELFGEERLREALGAVATAEAPTIVRKIRADVLSHATGAEQSDDITLVVVRYRGPKNTEGPA